jgi:uncharacterized membrane protein (UPF0127 family)
MKIENLTRQTVIADRCETACSFISRFLGLMGRKSQPDGCGLVITPCNSIHMSFMRFPLDIIFVDDSNTVVHTITGIKPWKISKIIFTARSVIELPTGTLARSGTVAGDKLELKK